MWAKVLVIDVALMIPIFLGQKKFLVAVMSWVRAQLWQFSIWYLCLPPIHPAVISLAFDGVQFVAFSHELAPQASWLWDVPWPLAAARIHFVCVQLCTYFR